MIIEIYSKSEPGRLLHLIMKHDAIPKAGRLDICPADQFIQVATLRPPKGTTYPPHRHNWNKGSSARITQECWIVISGVVKVYYYDLDGALISTEIITKGEISITFLGGHTYEILSEDTYVVEVKNGPYLGQEHDKTMI